MEIVFTLAAAASYWGIVSYQKFAMMNSGGLEDADSSGDWSVGEAFDLSSGGAMSGVGLVCLVGALVSAWILFKWWVIVPIFLAGFAIAFGLTLTLKSKVQIVWLVTGPISGIWCAFTSFNYLLG